MKRTVTDVFTDRIGNKIGLLPFGVGGIQHDFVALAVIRPKAFTLSFAVVGNNGVRRIKHSLRRAVVLFKPDELGVPILKLEAHDVFNRCAAETVDTLVIIADNTKIFVSAGQKLGQPELRVVGVLILVDHNIAKTPLIILTDIFEIFQKRDGVDDDIVKVHRVRLFQLFLIHFIRLTDAHFSGIVACLFQVFVGGNQAVLTAADFRQNRLERQCAVADIQLSLTFLD